MADSQSSLEKPDDNAKLPKKSPLNRLKGAEYPNIHGHSDILGGSQYHHLDPENPDAAASEHIHHDGTYHTKEVSQDKKGFHFELNHEVRRYISGGGSLHHDGQQDETGKSNKHQDHAMDTSHGAGGNQYKGAGGKQIGGSKEGSFHHNTDGNSISASKGDVVENHEGNRHVKHEGDQVHAVIGNRVDMVQGEYGTHVQGGGNYDTQVDSGKLRLKSGQDMLFESDSKITIKVGSSTIVIESGTITIKGGKIKFEQG